MKRILAVFTLACAIVAPGAWAQSSDGRGQQDADIAIELNGRVGVLSGTRVWLSEALDDGDNLRYTFETAEPGKAFAVMVTKDGGVAGGETAECTWTYTVKALDDTAVLPKNSDGDDAEGMTLETPRYHFCAYWYAGETRTAPAVATSRYGLACYDNGGDLHLLVCYGEIQKDDPC